MQAPQDIAIRPVRLADLRDLNATVNGICREGRFLSSADGFSLEVHRGFLIRVVRHGLPQVVAIAGAGVIGWCDILPAGRSADRHVGQLGVGVAKPYRHRGLGRRLVGRCLGMARDYGIERVELEVFADNEVAIALYRSFGFTGQGGDGRAGRDRDIIRMALELGR